MKENFEMVLPKSREVVFALMTDLERLAEAGKSAASITVKVEPVPDRPRTGRGAAHLIKSSLPGMGDVLVEVEEWDPPRRVVRRFHVKDLPTTVALTFDEVPEGTRLTVEVDCEPQSAMYKMMMPMIEERIKKEKGKALEMIKTKLEASQSPPEVR